MNPNDTNNQNNTQPVSPVNQTPFEEAKINSIAKNDEVPMSISPLFENSSATTQEVDFPKQVKNNLTIDTATSETLQKAQTPVLEETIKDENSKSLLNFQTNSLNPQQNININDFRVLGENKKEELSTLQNTQTSQFNEEPTQPTSQVNPPLHGNNQTMTIAVAGVLFFVFILGGVYFFISGNSSTKSNQSVGGTYKTEKIAVLENIEVKELSEEEYKTIIKSYIERYNKNIENTKLRLSQPNLAQDQQASIFMDYSTEVLDIYTGIQNLRVPTNFKDQHEKLSLSLYDLNSLFDTIVKTLKEKTSTTPINTVIATITKAEGVASASFNEIINSN